MVRDTIELGQDGRKTLSGHPRGLRTLFFTELWERFSYCGMRALLVLFMVAPVESGGLGFSATEAAIVYGNYTMAVYMLSIPGGFIADRLLGATRAVLFGGLIIAAGHFTLALPSVATFYTGLILVALGTGLFKPSISALVGALYRQGDERRDAGFSIFYMGINIGAFLAPLVTGFLAQGAPFKAWLSAAGLDPTTSWHYGFAAAGVGMVLGLSIFIAQAGYFRTLTSQDSEQKGGEEVTPSWHATALLIIATLILGSLLFLSDREGWTWLRGLILALPLLAFVWFVTRPDVESRRIAAILVFFMAAVVFWAIFEQAGLTIALFADQLTRTEVLGYAFPSAWFQSLNPIFVILLAPLFAALWMRWGERQPSSPVKFAAGLFFLALSFLLMVPAALLTIEGRVSPLWLVGLFFLQTVGELLLSPVGLSTMTKLAPVRATGLVLGVWFLASAFGNKLASVLGAGFTSSDPEGLSRFFLHQGLTVAAVALLLLMAAPFVRRLMGGIR